MGPELLLPGGVVVALDVPVVVGREPVAPPDLANAVAVVIAGDMSVSKTHALVEPSGGSVWVTDLNSSNGTEIIDADGSETRLQPGIPTVASSGSVIRVGSASDLTVRSAAPAATPRAATPPVAVTPAVIRPAAATWFDDLPAIADRERPVSPPPAAAPAPLPLVEPHPATVPSAPALETPIPSADLLEHEVLEHEQRRRIGGWVLVAWGALTALQTLLGGSYAGLQFPRSLFWFPSSVFTLVETAAIGLFPLAVAGSAGWMLRDPGEQKRVTAVFWSVGISFPLLVVGAVDGVLGWGANPFTGLTVFVLPVAGMLLLFMSLERATRPGRADQVAGDRHLPDRTLVAPTAPSGLEPLPLGSRIGAYILDGLLVILTLGIGWFVWSLVIWNRGQSPGKQAIGAVVVDANTGEVARFGTMALRELVAKGLIGTLTFGITGIVSSFMVLFGAERRGVHDHIASTLVVRADRAVRAS